MVFDFLVFCVVVTDEEAALVVEGVADVVTELETEDVLMLEDTLEVDDTVEL